MDSNKKEKKINWLFKMNRDWGNLRKKKTIEIWELNGPALRIHEHTDSLAKKKV